MAKELNETFPGIEAVNDFYTPYYMKEFLITPEFLRTFGFRP